MLCWLPLGSWSSLSPRLGASGRGRRARSYFTSWVLFRSTYHLNGTVITMCSNVRNAWEYSPIRLAKCEHTQREQNRWSCRHDRNWSDISFWSLFLPQTSLFVYRIYLIALAILNSTNTWLGDKNLNLSREFEYSFSSKVFSTVPTSSLGQINLFLCSPSRS